MVMDTLAGLAFSYEPPILEYMNEYPKKKTESILNKYMLNEILVTGLYSSLLCVIFLKSDIISSFYSDYNHLISAFFGLFIFMGIFNSLSARTTRLNLFKDITKNKVFIIIISMIALIQIIMIYYGGSIFRTVSLSFKEFMIMIILSSTVIPVDLLRKIILNKKGKKVQI
jgi:magnesium-transporting ATPase (P-type)